MESVIDAGLVLEGGGMRGVYTAGALDCLMDEGLYLSRVYGVSAGACHACSYLSRQRGRAARSVIDFVGDRRYAGPYSLLTTGDFFGVDMIYDEIPNRLLPFDYETYAASPQTLTAVLTNCRTGDAEYHPIRDMHRDMIRIRGSSSLPALSRLVEIDGEHYLDGGITDSIPLAHSIREGNRKNLVILTQHRGYQKSRNRMASALRLLYRRYPQLAQAVATRHIRYNEALARIHREEQKGAAFVLQPAEPVAIDRLEKDADKLRALYKDGYNDTRASLPALRRFWEE